MIYGVYLAVHAVTVTHTKYWLLGAAEFIGLENFIIALRSYAVPPALEYTFLFCLLAPTAEFILGLGLAMVANRKIKGLTALKSIIIMPMMATPIIVGYMWKVMFWPEIGIINYFLRLIGLKPVFWLGNMWTARLATIIVDIWQYTPFLFLIFLSGLSTLPREPYEAAMLDGASRWQILRHITLPLLKPLILVGMIFRVLDSFGSYGVMFTMTMGKPGLSTYPFTYHIYMTSYRVYNLGQGAALGWVALFISFIIAQVFIRWLRGAE